MKQEIIDATLLTFELMSWPIEREKGLVINSFDDKIEFYWITKIVNGVPVVEQQTHYISSKIPMHKIIKDVVNQLEEIQNLPIPEYVDDWNIEDFYNQLKE